MTSLVCVYMYKKHTHDNNSAEMYKNSFNMKRRNIYSYIKHIEKKMIIISSINSLSFE